MTLTNLQPKASQFIETVLALRLETAVFDCDGTLWSGDSGRDFFYWEIKQRLVSKAVAEPLLERYRLYELGEVDELAMCGDMVSMHHGLPVEKLYAAAEEFVEVVVAPRIFPDMQELTLRLAEAGCELWAVSSTNNWVVEAGVKRFGIPPNRVLAACLHAENGIATDRLIRVPTDELKAMAIHEVIGKPVHGVFGNSVHDQAMLELARHPFAVNPNPDLREVAKSRSWPVFWPDGTRA